MLTIVAAMMNWRSRLTGICTGDQAIFVTRSAFEQLSGFAPIALMEDIEFSKRAKRLSRPAAISTRVVTSGRRWQAPRYLAHDRSDVAFPHGVFFRRRSAAAGTALSRCALASLQVAQSCPR